MFGVTVLPPQPIYWHVEYRAFHCSACRSSVAEDQRRYRRRARAAARFERLHRLDGLSNRYAAANSFDRRRRQDRVD